MIFQGLTTQGTFRLGELDKTEQTKFMKTGCFHHAIPCFQTNRTFHVYPRLENLFLPYFLKEINRDWIVKYHHNCIDPVEIHKDT